VSPAPLLHAGATLLCAHGGQAQPVALDPRVRVSGEPIVVEPGPYAVAACALTGSGAAPCTTARFVTGAARVRAQGAAVLLSDGRSVCAPTGTPLQVVATQTRVGGI